MNTSEMVALAERVEAATGPDRELDCLIARLVDAVDARTASAGFGFGYVDRGQWACSTVPTYTASLDAAMTLVPEGLEWLRLSPGCMAVTLPPLDGNGDKHWSRLIEARAATPALALTAACLRACAALAQASSDGE